jgi:hypothetical protein
MVIRAGVAEAGTPAMLVLRRPATTHESLLKEARWWRRAVRPLGRFYGGFAKSFEYRRRVFYIG